MFLTDAQLHEIREIIRTYHNAFIVNNLGSDAVDPDTLKKLKDLGLVDPQLDNYAEESYLYGQLLAMKDDPLVQGMTYDQFKDYVRKVGIPLGPIERRAAEWASHSAAQYVVGLGNRVDTATGQLLIEADAQLRDQLRSTIRTETGEAIARRETAKQLKSRLGWATGDWTRDLDRIAVTEIQYALNRGTADNYAEKYGTEVEVYRLPAPDACEHCKRLHLGADGQPRIFTLSQLEANGTNVGRKAHDWQPVVGPVHPHCFPAGTQVLSSKGEVPIESLLPGDLIATREGRWQPITHCWKSRYSGKLVTVRTASAELSATAGHPFGIPSGWLQAELVQPGQQIVELEPGSLNTSFPDLNPVQQPAGSRQDVRFALVLQGLSRAGVPITAIYLDGQFYLGEGEINVDRLDWVVGQGLVTGILEPGIDQPFVGRLQLTDVGLCSMTEILRRTVFPADSVMRCLGHFLPAFQSSSCPPKFASLGSIAGSAAGLPDTPHDGVPGDMELLGYRFHTQQLVEVQIGDRGWVQFGVPYPAHSCSLDFRQTPTVAAHISDFDGFVYNLTVLGDSSFFANRICVHNCGCTLHRVPAGWGFNEAGELVPGGKLGERYESEEELELSARYQDDLRKAFDSGILDYQGIPVHIENAPGSVRHWKAPDGTSGDTVMRVPYGYVAKTNGVDEDEVDVFIGPDLGAERVFIIHQQDPLTGEYDEDKIMLGCQNGEQAQRLYSEHYDDPARFLLTATSMDVGQFKRWLRGTEAQPGEMGAGAAPIFIITMEKATGGEGSGQLDAAFATQLDPAGNRAPGPNLGVNYFIPVPDRDRRAKGKIADMPVIEMIYHPGAGENGGLIRDKEIYEFPEQLHQVHHLPPVVEFREVPEVVDAHQVYRNRERANQQIDRDLGRPRNVPEPEGEDGEKFRKKDQDSGKNEDAR